MGEEGKGGRVVGKVVDWNPKGYGFVEYNVNEEQIFVHQSQIKAIGFRKLEKGQKISFIIGTEPREGKLWCVDVRDEHGGVIRDEAEVERAAKKARKAIAAAEDLKDTTWRNPFGAGQVTHLESSDLCLPAAANTTYHADFQEIHRVGQYCALYGGLFGEPGQPNRCIPHVQENLHKVLSNHLKTLGDGEEAEAVQAAFEELDKEWLEIAAHPKKEWIDGCSAAVAIMTSGKHGGQTVLKLISAVCGDQVIILCNREGKAQRLTEPLTLKSFKEKQRVIEELGGEQKLKLELGEQSGMLCTSGPNREPLDIPVTRAIGARPFKLMKDRYIIPEPVVRVDMLTDAPLFCVIVSSSITKIIKDQDIVDMCLKSFDDVSTAAKKVSREALAQGSDPEVGCAVLDFTWRAAKRDTVRQLLIDRGDTKAPVDAECDMFG